jgi:ATP-binding protein involved in chromosome partitioning
MTAITQETILSTLDKTIWKNGSVADAIRGIIITPSPDGAHIRFAIDIDPNDAAAAEPIRQEAENIIRAIPNVASVSSVLTAHRQAPTMQMRPEPKREKIALPNIKKIIAIASGKGGVGKSTTSVNLAIACAHNGLRVGLVDADIYGPSIPRMLNLSGKPETDAEKKIIPFERYGIKTMSMGFFVAEDAPIIWRGPRVHTAIQQLFRDVAWGDLDILLVDLPPGTGDAHMTLAQMIPLTGAVIVSTPQDIALIDARKGLGMFQAMDVPVLGIIENMSYFACPHCGERSDIFSHGGARHEAEKLGLPFLGEIPLTIAVRQASDSGHPITASQPESDMAKIYMEIAHKLC